MIPSDIDLFDEDLEDEDDELEATQTYLMELESNRIRGYTDDLDAVRQAVYKILNTERYENVIYSWDYGIETYDLYGEDDTYVIPELQRRIEDALSTDERIVECLDFEFEKYQKPGKHGIEKKGILVKFTVSTIYGDADIEQVVNLDV